MNEFEEIIGDNFITIFDSQVAEKNFPVKLLTLHITRKCTFDEYSHGDALMHHNKSTGKYL